MTDERWRRIEEICHHALTIDATVRVAFLLEACGGDVELHREAVSLLANEFDARQFLESERRSRPAEPNLIGRRVGAYQIVSLLGAGGMGEVYRARDTTLDREVALKVVPAAFSADETRLVRLRREARMLASLNHPNIAGIYQLEHADGIHALVLELVEGETLADRVATGPVPIAEALRLGRQMTEAVGAAHEQGIVHRDLKPANIKITSDGIVKILDFGLAKALAADPAPHPVGLSTEGMILGTAAYMSPEQARGQAVDKRTDIWAFGCVMFEMLTGTCAFAGENVGDVLMSVMTKAPDWSALDERTPPSILRLLRRCLQKDLKQRLADIGDARLDIEDVLSESNRQGVAVPAAVGERRRPMRSTRRWDLAASTLIVAISIAGSAAWIMRRPAPMAVTRTTVSLPGATSLTNSANGRDIVITPDGTRVIFIGNGGTELHVRSLDQLHSTVLVSAPRSLTAPFVSPDSRWVGYLENGALKKVPITGGQPVTLVASGVFGGATWDSDGTIVFAPGFASGLRSISADGGNASPLTTATYPREIAHILPEFLPDGRAVLFTILTSGGIDAAEIAILDLRTSRTSVLLRGGSHAHFAATGHLVYASSGSLRAVAFDPERLEVLGTAVPIVSGVVTKPRGAADFAAAHNGTLVYVAGAFGPAIAPMRGEMVTIGRGGEPSPLLPVGDYREPRLSPDGKMLAVSDGSDIWMHDLARGSRVKLTTDGSATRPVWTHDGSRVLFRSAMFGEDLFSIASDGSGRPESLLAREGLQYSAGVSPDGSVVLLDEMDTFGGRDIVLLRNGGVTTFLATRFSERSARFSPDGRWIAYVSNESGRDEVYLRPYPGPGPKVAVSVNGGTEPVWSPVGNELFYRHGRRFLSVSVRADPLVVGSPQIVIEGDYVHDPGPNTPSYDVFPDGRRFVVIRGETQQLTPSPSSVILVQNWFEELRRLVPIK